MKSGITNVIEVNAVIALAYIFFPLSQMISDPSNQVISRNWIDIAWIFLTVLAVFTIRIKREPSDLTFFCLTLLSSVLLLCLSFQSIFSSEFHVLPIVLDTKVLVYLIIALIISNSKFGPDRAAFCMGGVALSAIIIMEFVVRSMLSGKLERPVGSGEINYDAALILLSLILSMSDSTLRPYYKPILLLGLICTFSRTGLIGAILVVLISNTTSRTLKFTFLAIASISIVYSFIMRDLAIGNLAAMDRYWMWKSSYEYFLSDPLSTFVQIPGSEPLQLTVPNELSSLWQDQASKLQLNGVYPFHLHAFWLRLSTTWGWFFPALLLAVVLFHAIRRRTNNEGRMYLVTFVVLGSTMGLLYLSNVAVPYYLAAFILLSRGYESDRPPTSGPV